MRDNAYRSGRRRGHWLHTTEEVLVDLLAVVLGNKPGALSVKFRLKSCANHYITLSRVPGAIRGIALTTPEKMGDLKDGEWSSAAIKVCGSLFGFR